jgi:hypothetical protein
MKRFLTCFISGLLVITIFSGCSGLTVEAFSPTATATATLVPTPIPTATPEPNRVTIVAPPEILPETVKALTDAIQPAVSQAGLVIETLGQIPSGSLGPNRKAAIFLIVPGNLVDIINANPDTQILVLSNADLQTGPTLTVVREHPEFLAFIAGYTTAAASPNWRAAGLIPSNGSETNELANAFKSGGRYLCGRCGTSTPPFAAYPLTESLPGSSTPAEWNQAVGNILPAGLETLYFSKEAQSPELLQALVSQNILFVGTKFPGEEMRNRWAATLSMDSIGAVAKALPDMLAGQGGKTIQVGIALSDVNDAYISAGKLRLINQTNEMLMKGWINPYTVSG